MGISYNPSIVTEGVVLGLDPQSTRSYVGSGTTWTDLTNRGNSGTLTNGPVFIPGGPFNNSGGSVFFDESGDFLSIPTSADFAIGSGDYTAECWVYPQSTGEIIGAFNLNANFKGWLWSTEFSSAAGRQAIFISDNSSYNTYYSNTAVPQNQWSHIAFSKVGTTWRFWLNGVLDGSFTDSRNPSDSQQQVNIGADSNSTSSPGRLWKGFISNLHVVKGTALYTSNFTPPTGPLEAIDDTVLLTCQGGAITDNGPSSHAITVNNDAKAVTASAFEFDGTNDYAVTSSNTDFLFGTEEFAMEWWEYFTGGTDYQGHIGVFQYGGGDGTAHIWTVSGSFYGFPGGWTSIAMQPISNQWAHYVVTGTSGDIKFYQNGELKDTKTWDWSATSSTSNFAVGGTPGWSFGNYAMPGKISAVRVYKGKSFTEDEVKRNFSALRGRYGI